MNIQIHNKEIDEKISFRVTGLKKLNKKILNEVRDKVIKKRPDFEFECFLWNGCELHGGILRRKVN